MLWNSSKVGLHDHERFLQHYPPYSSLDELALEGLVRDLEISYLPRGARLDVSGGLFVVRRGELELGGEHYSEGETLGGGVQSGEALASADTWLYVLPPDATARWLSHPTLVQFFTSALSTRLDVPSAGVDLGSTPITEVMKAVEIIDGRATVQQAAAQMRDARTSSLLIPQEGHYGIVTDKDLRNKVLAGGLPLSTPVADIMTAPALTVSDDTTALSALNVLFRHNIRHLPVVRRREAVGMVGAADLLRLQTRGPGHIVQDLLDAPDAQTLAALARQLPQHAAQLYAAGQRADQVARITSYAYDALYRRAISLTQEQLGAPPCPFAWVLVGSVARRETALNPDQDHVLIIGDEAHRPYFHALAERVEDLLDRAGVPRCSGGVMASAHLYTIDQYERQLQRWYRVPDPQALLNVTIFFDPRVVAGELDISRLRRARLAAREHPLFMGHLTRLALENRPPLGFRRRIRTGPKDTLDLKVRGLALIIDLARLHALTVGEALASTTVRLRAPGNSILHPDTREDLVSAHAYLTDLRYALQARQLKRGETPSNLLTLSDLSAPQEVHLREIYKLIARVHETTAQELGR